MKRHFRLILLAVFMAAGVCSLNAQGLRSFRLANGLSVYVWEDASKPDVYGEVVVKAGSFNDPEQYTGLAHYLEHMMFKGTRSIGALNWEAEEQIYNSIIEKYDLMADAQDLSVKEQISAEINALSVEESKLSALNEYAALVESMGGTGLNAATSFDFTIYHNSFPPSQVGKWIRLASERFINPLFRAFQSERETVYEEYNMGNDNPASQAQQFMLGKVFEGQPYARPVIGLGEHLKNPRLSQLIKFYEDWYVPSNMALILVGNVSAQSIIRTVNSAFGRFPARECPELPECPPLDMKGRSQYTSKVSQYPSVVLAYNGVPTGHPDEIPLEVCVNLLSNTMNTGLLDKLSIDGNIMGGAASSISFTREGRILLTGIPYYDRSSGTYDSNKKVEKLLTEAVSKVASGKLEPWMLDAIKLSLCRDFDLEMEDNEARAAFIRNIFISSEDVSTALDYPSRVQAVSLEDVQRVAKQYFGKNFIAIYNEMGKPSQGEKISKPKYDPLQSPAGATSMFAAMFKAGASPSSVEQYVDFSAVQQRSINDYSRLYYSRSEENDVFSLVLKYGAGSNEFPLLEYAASLMDNAGIMASFTPQELKEEFAKIGVTLTLSADDEYMYVTMRGYEQSLQQACNLLTRTLLMPSLDEAQLNNLIGSLASSRMMRRDNVNIMASALGEYMAYGENSSYLKEVTDRQIIDMTVSELTGTINKAAGYAADIFYTGVAPFDDVYEVLSHNLPLVSGEKPAVSPVVRPVQDVAQNTVYFLPVSNAKQCQIIFFSPCGTYDKKDKVYIDAFNRYFGGGFSGIVMREIREYNSMAYTATGSLSTRALPGSPLFFSGYIGTQNDNAVEAVKLYMRLLRDMPSHPEMTENIKTYLHEKAFTDHPTCRELTQKVALWTLRGYDDDPAKEEIPLIDSLTFDDILTFYNGRIRSGNVAIGIVGDPKQIDLDALSEFGNIVRLKESDLFNQEDKLFSR